jgi:hypothetical protein
VRWCSDGLELSCDNGEKVRVAFALNCCDRENMSGLRAIKDWYAEHPNLFLKRPYDHPGCYR